MIGGCAAAEFAAVPDARPRGWRATEHTQVALFELELALAAQWRAWGVEPDVVIGHSLGELVAACVAGALTVDKSIPLHTNGAYLIIGGRRPVSRCRPILAMWSIGPEYPSRIAVRSGTRREAI